MASRTSPGGRGPASSGDRKLVFATPRQTQEDLLVVRDLVEEGRYRAVVDRVFPLEDVVAAHRYVETWRKVGSVVLVLDPEGRA
jgi:NADPH2:quinone reductase